MKLAELEPRIVRKGIAHLGGKEGQKQPTRPTPELMAEIRKIAAALAMEGPEKLRAKYKLKSDVSIAMIEAGYIPKCLRPDFVEPLLRDYRAWRDAMNAAPSRRELCSRFHIGSTLLDELIREVRGK